MIHVSLQPVPGYLQPSLYKENIRMDHECDGSIQFYGYINHGGKTGKTELC